jgi:uncharacterized protein YvpB
VAGKRLGTVTASNAARFRLPSRLHVRQGRTRLVVVIPEARSRRAIRSALAAHKKRLDLRVTFVSSSIAIAPVRQVLHNNCEATALSMILAAAGHPVGQLKLQAQLPQSGPLDPVEVPGSDLFQWGDPERGFVGRLLDLRGRRVGAVRAAVLSGHPVLAWVGLAAGPYLSWLTPSGREITVNLNEHAVALVGAGPGYMLVDNPLTGLRERWSESLFSYRWKLLGRRALELPGS